MAQMEQMIPFLLHVEAGLKVEYILGHTLEQMFVQAKKTGYANDPADSGGATMCGVTIAAYRAYRKAQGYPVTTVADLKNISFVAWKAILRRYYWEKCRAGHICTQMVAVAIVDWCWGSGANGIKGVQRVLGVDADGIFGPVTLAAVNNYPDQHELFDKIQEARNAYHASIAKPGSKNHKFLNGWNRRVAKITWGGFSY